jgi:hypothetical protein
MNFLNIAPNFCKKTWLKMIAACHVHDIRELQRKLDHDAKLQEFFAIKGQQRLNTEQQEREADKKKKRVKEMERKAFETLISKYLFQLLSGEKEVDKIISKFVKDEENYALFNYVNELSHEIEQLNETAQKLPDIGLISELRIAFNLIKELYRRKNLCSHFNRNWTQLERKTSKRLMSVSMATQQQSVYS